MNTGIYYIQNTISGAMYVGSTTRNMRDRWGRHINHLNKGKHRNRHLQNAWNLYGGMSFRFGVLEWCDKLSCIVREQHYLDSISPEYNICHVAGSTLGHRHTPETRAKISLAGTGKSASPEARAKMSVAQKGHHRHGWHLSPEARAKISAAFKGRPSKLLGRIMPYGVRAKISLSLRGHHTSPETRAKISKALKGRTIPPFNPTTILIEITAPLHQRKKGTHEHAHRLPTV